MGRLTHTSGQGRLRMVDVGSKKVTSRRAVAEGRIKLGRAYKPVRDNALEKGAVEECARIAGIQAAKGTFQIIPLCHPLILDFVDIDFRYMKDSLVIRCTVSTQGKTGAEMEALTGVAVACLTVYDMAKGVDKGMEIVSMKLLEKQGGKSGHWKRGKSSKNKT
ncbi:MAG: cyclic pyranopterin monophosphate synthase MoaC [Planctomycetota bacterium]